MNPVERANLYVGTALSGWAAALQEADQATAETQLALAELGGI